MRPVLPAVRRIVLALVGLGLAACASAPRTHTYATIGKDRIEGGRPDTAGILSLLGRWATAHACPIVTPSGCNAIVLTAAHVIDPRPFEADVPLLPYRYSDGYGSSGVLEPVATERCADLATMRLGPGADVRPYRRAALAPEVGAHVWFVGYEWSLEVEGVQRTDDPRQGGRRLADDDAPKKFAEGDYARIGGSWWIRPPGGHLGELTEHEVEEHEDGTISVRPSIVDSKHGVHVYLDHGVWRQV